MIESFKAGLSARTIANALLFGLALCLAPQAASAQLDPKKQTYEAFERLLGTSLDRTFYGLPETEFWRAEGNQTVGLFSPNYKREAEILKRLIAVFNERCPAQFSMILATDPDDPEIMAIAVVPDFQIHVGTRQAMAEKAERFMSNPGQLQKFKAGRWPFLFDFPRTQGQLGQVWIAKDAKPEVVERSLLLALIWAQGGVALGRDLRRLAVPSDGGPLLTVLGQDTLNLFCDSRLKNGTRLSTIKRQAADILEQTD